MRSDLGQSYWPQHLRREIIRDHFETHFTDAQRLREAKREAAQWEVDSRLKEELAGRGTLSLFLNSSLRLAEAERELGDKGANDLAAAEGCWELTWLIDETLRSWYEEYRLSRRVNAEAHYYLLEAVRRLAEARGRFAGGVQRPSILVARLMEQLPEGAVDAKKLAQAKFETLSVDLREVAEARLAFARIEFEAEQFPGRASQIHDHLLSTAGRLLSANLAVTNAPAERLAALERYWTLAWKNETEYRIYFEVGRVSVKEYAEARYVRLDAELALLAALTKAKD